MYELFELFTNSEDSVWIHCPEHGTFESVGSFTALKKVFEKIDRHIEKEHRGQRVQVEAPETSVKV